MGRPILEYMQDENTRQRFTSKVDSYGTLFCWKWMDGCDRHGYGMFRFKGLQVGVHRIAWVLYNQKDIPRNMHVCHICDNRKCCNPQHLVLGSPQDNSNDMKIKNRQYRDGRKLSKVKVLEIRAIYDRGDISKTQLAKKYGVRLEAISNVVKRKTWQHI